MNPERLLAEEEQAWQRFHALVESVPPERCEEPTVTPEGWSLKDVMFHVGAWLADCARIMEQIRFSTFDRAAEDALDIEALNAQGFAVSRTMDLRDVRVMCESARTEARLGFGSLPELTADAWEWFEESGPLHYAKHVEDLEAWLG
jgi:Mycothiol maleylpyruvate isomerase N-terminal domain